MKNNQLVFQESAFFIKNFFTLAKRAKRRIWVQTMFFEPGAVTIELEQIIIKAIARGVDVRFTIDWITKYYYEDQLRLLPTWQKKWGKWEVIDRKRRKLITWLQELGVLVTVVHKPGIVKSLVPMGGRNHNKIYIVDNTAWIGGVNMASEIGSRDVMIKLTNTKALEFLNQCYLFADTISSDKMIKIDNEYTLFYDTGKPLHSIILKDVLSIINRAEKKIVIVSQFIPDMTILSALRERALRGIAITIITGDKKSDIYTKFPLNIFYLLCKLQIHGINAITLYHYKGKVHAKLLVIDDSVAIIGSYNFIWSTVFLGTTEIAIKTSAKTILLESRKFIFDLLKNSEKAF